MEELEFYKASESEEFCTDIYSTHCFEDLEMLTIVFWDLSLHAFLMTVYREFSFYNESLSATQQSTKQSFGGQLPL